ncbi:25104_t:CDS:2 [Gigaspora rosea]|nr:25104_t:CDS:2 [Gigaspora rosea]
MHAQGLINIKPREQESLMVLGYNIFPNGSPKKDPWTSTISRLQSSLDKSVLLGGERGNELQVKNVIEFLGKTTMAPSLMQQTLSKPGSFSRQWTIKRRTLCGGSFTEPYH